MKTYALLTLLRVKEHDKDLAFLQLRKAAEDLNNEKAKLKNLASSLNESKQERCRLQEMLFSQRQAPSLQHQEIQSIASSSQKQVAFEAKISEALKEQRERVRLARLSFSEAQSGAISADSDCKLIEKHRANWQTKIKKSEEVKEEYNNDDFNGAKFCINK
jgi:hypothetical protein